MTPPTLRPTGPQSLAADVRRALLADATGPVRFYEVTEAGRFDGLALAEGTVIVVGGRPLVDSRVVLLPAGRGRVQLGHVRREGLRGAVGEACDARRWTVAGRVRAVVAPVAAAPERVWGPRQLSLFGAGGREVAA